MCAELNVQNDDWQNASIYLCDTYILAGIGGKNRFGKIKQVVAQIELWQKPRIAQ